MWHHFSCTCLGKNVHFHIITFLWYSDRPKLWYWLWKKYKLRRYTSQICGKLFLFQYFSTLKDHIEPEPEQSPMLRSHLLSAGEPKRQRSFWWESFFPVALSLLPRLGLMSWINACHVFRVQSMLLSHPGWTISASSSPTIVLSCFQQDLGLASLHIWRS